MKTKTPLTDAEIMLRLLIVALYMGLIVLVSLACDMATAFLVATPTVMAVQSTAAEQTTVPTSQEVPNVIPTATLRPDIGVVMVDTLEIRADHASNARSSDIFWKKDAMIPITGCFTDAQGNIWVSFQLAGVERWSASRYQAQIFIKQTVCK